MSDSPRTDFQDNRGNGLVRADFARNLERELAAVQRLSLEDVDKVHDKLDVAQARIAELERCHKLWQADSERYRVTMNDADKRIAELECPSVDALLRAAKAVRYILDTDDPEGGEQLEMRIAKAAIDAARKEGE